MKKIWLLTLIMLHTICSANTPLFISLGGDCEAAWQLMHFNLREAAFPFDWVRSYDFSGICLALQEQCCNFLNPDYLIYTGIIKNTRYNFEFVHDFPTIGSTHVALENENCGTVVPNYLDHLTEVKDKYQRRINRLINVIKNGRFIIFLRTDITPQQAATFVEMMTNTYPQAHYLLLVLHNNQQYNHQWSIPHVTAIYANKENSTEPNGWYPKHYWATIFAQEYHYTNITHAPDQAENTRDKVLYELYKGKNLAMMP